MSFGKIKIRPADQLFSKYLRKARGYKCERCARYCPGGKGLEVSHFYSRRNESVRFDTENADVLCKKCHMRFSGWFDSTANKTNGVAEYREWKLQKMGQKDFDLLCFRSHQAKKKDDAWQILWLKKAMAELETC